VSAVASRTTTPASRRAAAPSVATSASDAGRPPSAGGGKLSQDAGAPSRSPRRNAMKPPSGAWRLRKETGASEALTKAWATSGGIDANVPAASVVGTPSGPSGTVSSPSSTKNASVCSW